MGKELFRFRTDKERALAFATLKSLERCFDDEKTQGIELAPGFKMNVSGLSLTITQPPDTTVEKDAGINGDGLRPTTPTTDLYGFTLLAVMLEILSKFKQHRAIYRLVTVAARRAFKKGKTLGEQLKKEATTAGTPTERKQRVKELYQRVEQIRQEVLAEMPPRQEPTRRKYNQKHKLPPTLKWLWNSKAA